MEKKRNEGGIKCLDVQDGKDADNTKILGFYSDEQPKDKQQWTIVMADEYPSDPKKGEFSEKFGLYVERPFHIVSQLSSNRYLTYFNNADLIIKTPNGRTDQVWFFDIKSLTVKSEALKGKSLNVGGNGGNNKGEIQNTNSNWW
jgi:hypothetical protein